MSMGSGYALAIAIAIAPLVIPSRPAEHLAMLGDFLSIAHEVSGLGSTRVVRFSVPKGSGDDGTGTVATGPENAEVQGRFEPLGAAGAVGNGRGGDSGGGGAAISALPAALRGRRAPRAAGQAPGQGLGQAGAGRRDRMDARRVPDRI